MPRTSFRSPLLRTLAAALVGCALLSLPGAPAHAGPPPWSDAPYTYYAESQPLAKVLRDFAASFSLALELSPQVTGPVNGRFSSPTPTDFLNQLGGVYGFNWFTHAGTLYVSRTTETTTRSITASGASIGAMRQALTSLGVLDTRFGWGELPDQGVALVSGPPGYVSLVQRTVAALPLVAGGQQVTVFRLKHATVDDRTVLYRDRQITTTGLAQVLRNLVNGSGTGGTYSDATLTAIAAPLRASSTGMAPATTVAGAAPGAPVAAGGGESSSDAKLAAAAGQQNSRRLVPSIQADSRLNALIIQDIPERLPIYQKLIEQLDVPTALIEIEALIIDVNATRLDELGIAWGGRTGGTTAGFGNLAASTSGNEITLGAVSRSATVNPTSLVVSAGNFLVTRIRALEGMGEASIQSRPSILTVDHIGALLDLSETFYIRTTGERVATVTPVTVGTTLRVTPHYIERANGAVVQLDVDIEDGQIQDRTIDDLPTIRKSVVSTQAIVGENQTLLIGGYNTRQATRQNDRVPGLGRLPVVGLFFSNRTDNVQSRERLFMIKPRLVTLPSPRAAGAAPTGAEMQAASAAAIGASTVTVLPAPGGLPVTVSPAPSIIEPGTLVLPAPLPPLTSAPAAPNSPAAP
ncbi:MULTISPECIES: type III secretion system outer membrane ring subunit SctC [unclassified Variovorax]|uniref:type III secretion system outer membrane ring subunit SctC n=1 Tax=unclassified Variovorax TaxID=663243 RepID=UPI0008CAB92A|nr:MULTISPECIES: type III secretion system outer membrane ring subunit SctC [unclassified Variovorax]SEK10056.1 type III secretion protein C [Variovorax sp. OK202]SFD66084.1 type III secretion protein C [Variovorax sp. OK212]